MKLHFIYNRINTILVSIVLASTTCMADNLVLRYERPADFFEEALVIGNGTLGATVYGGIRKDRLSLNNITLWTGITASAATPLPSPVIIANGETRHKHLRENRPSLHFQTPIQTIQTIHFNKNKKN